MPHKSRLCTAVSPGFSIERKHYLKAGAASSICLCAAQKDDSRIIAESAFATELMNRFHQSRNAAIVGRQEIAKAIAPKFLVLAIQGFGNSVGIEQQSEIMAEGQSVLGELAWQQPERQAGVSMERAHIISMAQ